LTQIFSNLLQNASKFTERGGKIAVRAERSEGDVLVSVRDTGVGIAPEMLESIYELFSQGDRSLQRHQGGLGIGLTIVKRLVELQGNTVRTAVDGVHAVAEAEAFRPDVVLLDVGMPNMNGYDACRRIRAEEWGRNMLLLAVTGWGQEGDRARSHAAGFDQHF